MSVSFPGSDVLFAPSVNASGSPAASTPSSSASASSTPAASSASNASNAPAATQNPYQQTYDSIETWSDQYLMQSIESGAPPIPQYTAGGTASSFAQLTNMLAQIQPGVANGTYGGGTGIDTTA